MPRTRPSLVNFNAGELTPLMDGRVDQDKYFSGCKVLSNFIPTVQGPVRRRGGTRRVGATKNSGDRAWFADFVFSADQSYILEFGNFYLRFWVNRGQLLNGGVPYEIVTPYAVADLVTAEGTFALQTLQSNDVMWLTHVEGKYPQQKLSRLGATNWTFVENLPTDGPFRDLNADKTVTMQASGETGTVTITASSAIFLAGHVGSLIQLASANPSTVSPYQAAASVAIGDEIRNAGNVYQAQNNYTYVSGDQTQRYVPVHTEGTAFDGHVTWLYLHSGYGWGTITAIGGGGTTATVTVISRLPDQVVTANTYRWAFSEFSAVYGWPTCVAFFKERLTYARGKQVFHSFIGDYDSFLQQDAGLVTEETAISIALAADKLDNIAWMSPTALLLLIGSSRSELSLQEQTSQKVYAADNIQNTPQTDYGSRLLRALPVNDSVLFVDRAGHRIREAMFSFEINKYKAEDVTVLSEHLFDGSEVVGSIEQQPRDIVDWAYQQQRDSIVWCVCSDGTVVGLVLNRERGVIALSPYYFGGDGVIVEAVRTIPSPDGRSDDAWFIVQRTVNGAVQRSVEYMTDYRLVKLGAQEAVHVDCSTTYRGTPTTTITGLGYLEGETVSVCIDGTNSPDKVVNGGQITLDRPGSLVHVGYRFASKLQTMRLEVQGGGGTSQTARKAIAEVWLRLQSTISGQVGPSFDKMDTIPTLNPKAFAGTPPALYSGDYKMQFPNGFDTNAYVCFQQDKPLPATAVALIMRATIND